MRHDLTSLELFVAVAECGNLTRAAERQHLAVSAVSKRVVELEALAGTPLLVRQARGVMLTPAGQSLLHHARQMLQLVRRMDEEMGAYAGGMKGHVRLHAVASALTQFLPAELESFLSRYPDVQVSLEERTGKAIARAVADGSADLGIVASPVALGGLTVLPYRTDRLMLGVPSGHALARRKAVRFAEALQYPFVGPHAESSLSMLMQQGAQACGGTLQQRVQVSSFDAMCRLAETRLGITLLPAGVLAPHVAAGRLRGVELKEAWAAREMSIVVRELGELSHITRGLIDHLQRAAGGGATAP
jgi:DNA-binding transcriptional LysR family regulator